jgi:hypothetical protein
MESVGREGRREGGSQAESEGQKEVGGREGTRAGAP